MIRIFLTKNKQITNRKSMKKTKPKPITIKLFKTSDKEKTLNAARGRHITYRENKEKNDNKALLRRARGQLAIICKVKKAKKKDQPRVPYSVDISFKEKAK